MANVEKNFSMKNKHFVFSLKQIVYFCAFFEPIHSPKLLYPMEMMKNAINWVEIPVVDFDRAKQFYEKIYDYSMPVQDMGPVKMGFLLSEQDEYSVGGAICAGEGNHPAGATGVRVYLNGGKDLQVVLSRVEAAGGQVTMPKTQISPEYGHMAFFNDTEGNNIGLHSMG
jgi:uncharacterized protein